MEQYLSDQNQLHIFDNDNFSIIPKSIFSDNDNLPISCKNAEISAVDNFFDNIAHPYQRVLDWIGFTFVYGVSTALRIVFWYE